MRRRLLVGLFLILSTATVDAQVIRNIEIIRKQVFDDGELPGGAGSIFNALHVKTKKYVIRRDLLFHEGDVLDTFLVMETARLLRNRRYIAEVRIGVTEIHPDTVDISVETRDLWTLELSFTPSGGGGAYNISLELSDVNFRGRAQDLSFGVNITDRRSTGFIRFIEPALFGSRMQGTFSYSKFSDGHFFAVGLSHPFWAVTVPWEYGVEFRDAKDNLLFYKEREAAFEYPSQGQSARVSAARVWGRTSRVTVGGSLGWAWQVVGPVVPDSGVPPELLAETTYYERPDERRVGPGAGIGVSSYGFEGVRFLDRFGRVEDFPRQVGVSLNVGRISKLLGSTVNRNRVGANFQAGAAWKPIWTTISTGVSWESDYGDSPGMTSFDANMKLYFKPASRHVFAFNASYTGWYHANRIGQMFIGALSGVRGLPARYDDGTRRWTANGEYRFFSPLSILTVNLGGVVFTDAGQVWNRDDNPRLFDTPWTWGFGIRLGLSRIAAERIIRMDWARGPEGWITTFGFGMYFPFNLGSLVRY